MPERGKPVEPHKGFTDKCYKEKGVYWGKATEYLDNETREWVKPEEYFRRKAEREGREEVNAPNVSRWQKEWSYAATGKRMSKGELKRYCKKFNKQWLNG